MHKEKGVRPPSEKGSVPYEEKILQRIPAEILLLSLIIAFLTLIPFDKLTGLFIFAGGGFSALSFIWLKTSVSRLLIPDRKKAVKSAIAFYSLRLLLILAIFSIIIIFFSKRIIAFVIGLSMIVPVILVESILGLSKLKKWKS